MTLQYWVLRILLLLSLTNNVHNDDHQIKHSSASEFIHPSQMLSFFKENIFVSYFNAWTSADAFKADLKNSKNDNLILPPQPTGTETHIQSSRWCWRWGRGWAWRPGRTCQRWYSWVHNLPSLAPPDLKHESWT